MNRVSSMKILLTAALGVALTGTNIAWGQAKAAAKGAAPAKAAAIDPEQLKAYQEGSSLQNLQTSDGVYLTANYWSPKGASKSTPVVILLHMRGRNQLDWFPFAKRLHEDGFAVITFDMRGHGESRQINPDTYLSPREALAAEGKAKSKGGAKKTRTGPPRGDKIDHADEFRTSREIKYIANDLEVIKEFLVKENNSGRLNIKQLGMVAAGELACHVAMMFAELEYEGGGRTGFMRQGADLSALVLINPTRGFQGGLAPTKLGEGGELMPMLLVSTNASKSEFEVSRFARTVKIPGQGETVNPNYHRPESIWIKIESPLEGTDLLRPPVADLDAVIHGFLKGRLVGKPGGLWSEREIEERNQTGGFGGARKKT